MRFTRKLLHPLVLMLCITACSSGDPDSATASAEPGESAALTADSASRFAKLALDCMHREYPNKLGQVLKDETGLLPPKALHPAFYGCFDWHSSVHGHWMLVKLLKSFPRLPLRQEIIDGLSQSLTPENIAGEIAYLENASASWERTYGWAWLLQLATELEQWDDPLGRQWADTLAPLTRLIRDRYIEFLPRQEYPIRTGVHPNTAFGLSFAFDYAETVSDGLLTDAILSAANRYYAEDEHCPLSWEPSGEDFLSPCFEEAALMARSCRMKGSRPGLRRFCRHCESSYNMSMSVLNDMKESLDCPDWWPPEEAFTEEEWTAHIRAMIAWLSDEMEKEMLLPAEEGAIVELSDKLLRRYFEEVAGYKIQ